jgi:hypothetical protein
MLLLLIEYLKVIFNLIYGHLLILLPFGLAIFIAIFYMNSLAKVWSSNLLADYNLNIANISIDKALKFTNSRMGTVLLSIALYMASSIVSMIF